MSVSDKLFASLALCAVAMLVYLVCVLSSPAGDVLSAAPLSSPAANVLSGSAAEVLSGSAAQLPCRVERVLDGDTLDVYCNFIGAARVRMACFDAAEHGSIDGDHATAVVRAAFPKGSRLNIEVHGVDRYDRLLVSSALDAVVPKLPGTRFMPRFCK